MLRIWGAGARNVSVSGLRFGAAMFVLLLIDRFQDAIALAVDGLLDMRFG
jgi:hypothetical protein